MTRTNAKCTATDTVILHRARTCVNLLLSFVRKCIVRDDKNLYERFLWIVWEPTEACDTPKRRPKWRINWIIRFFVISHRPTTLRSKLSPHIRCIWENYNTNASSEPRIVRDDYKLIYLSSLKTLPNKTWHFFAHNDSKLLNVLLRCKSSSSTIVSVWGASSNKAALWIVELTYSAVKC